MTQVDQHIAAFKRLNGRTVSVSALKQLKSRIDAALKSGHRADLDEISKRLDKGIKAAGSGQVKVNVQAPKVVHYHHEDLTMLYGVDCIQDDKDYDGKALDGISDTTYKVVTDKIIDMMKAGGLIWRKPWKMNVSESSNLAHNYKTKHVYRGTNFYLNWMNYPTPYFFSFKQVGDAGGKVKAGEKGNPIVYFKWLYKDIKKQKLVDAKVALDKNGKLKAGYDQIPGLFYYMVFNHSQTEGITIKAKPAKPRTEDEKIESAEAIVAGMPSRPPIKNEAQDRAFYSPHYDSVTMPLVSYFKVKPEYYSVLFHELIHSTGSPKRLARDMSGRQFDKKYCFEELIAEVSSCFLCAESGILYHTLKNSAAYVKGYFDNLIGYMKGDPKFFLNACSQAQKAADFILGDTSRAEQPKPGKKLKRLVFKPKSRGKKREPKKPDAEKPKPKTIKERAPKKRREASVPGVKASVSAAIDDLVKHNPSKYGKKAMAMAMLYSTFNADRDAVELLADDELKFKLLNKESWIELDHKSEMRSSDYYRLSTKGSAILDTIEGRLSSLRVKKQGGELFPDLKGPHNLGFVSADKAPDRVEGTFTLPGEIGKLLGEQQRYKLEIVIAGETHSSKSELGKQIADAFCSAGDEVAWIDWEQGGLRSKDTRASIERNVKPENRKRFHVSSDVPRSKAAIKALAKDFKVIALDSGTKLNEVTNAWIDELREEQPNTVWIILMQQNAKGVARGGPAAEFDAPVVLKTYRPDEDDYAKNYAYVFKNRGNKTGQYYSISGKKILARNPELPEPEKAEEPKSRVTL